MRFWLNHDLARSRALEAVKTAPAGFRVTVDPPGRTLDQNAKLHAILQDVAEAKEWHGERLTVDEWKRLFSAAVFREKMLPGIGGGIVIVPKFTRRMSKSELSEMIEFIHAWAVENGVTING
jgi:hypothetical protein